jgi:hypothetical protein
MKGRMEAGNSQTNKKNLPNIMNRKLLIVLAASAAFAASAQADQWIGVAFQVQSTAETKAAGVEGPLLGYGVFTGTGGQQTLWNYNSTPLSAGGSGTLGTGSTLFKEGASSNPTSTSLLDSSGVATGVGFSITYENATYGQVPWANVSPYPGDSKLGFARLANTDGTPLTLTLSGLNPSGTYAFIDYMEVNTNDAGAQPETSVSMGGSTYYFEPFIATSYPGTWTQITSTDPANPTVGGEVAVFGGLTPAPDGTLTVMETCPAGSAAVGMSGFQLVSVASVPEPATIWSMIVGLLGFAGLQMKRYKMIARS